MQIVPFISSQSVCHTQRTSKNIIQWHSAPELDKPPRLRPKAANGNHHIPMFFFLGILQVPSGKHTKNDGKSHFLMGKSIISGHFQ